MKSADKNIKSALIKTTNSIKKKYSHFHRNKQLNQENLKEFYKPVIESINNLHTAGSPINIEKKHGVQNAKSFGIVASTPKTRGRVYFENDDDEDNSDRNDNRSNHSNPHFDSYEIGDSDKTNWLTNDSGAMNTALDTTRNLTKQRSPHLKQYLNKINQNKTPKFDNFYGIRQDGNQYLIGNEDVKFDDSGDIVIKNLKYGYTKGLYDLLFYAKPPPGYSKDDLINYKKILSATNAHKKNYEPGNSIRANNSYKYSNIIKGLFKTGTGLPSYFKTDKDSTSYAYWDDPNELVNRLRLLISSKSAGHTGHENEIISIIEELREAKIVI